MSNPLLKWVDPKYQLMQCECESGEGVWEFRSRGRIRREKSGRRENKRREEKRARGEDNTILCLLFKSSKSTKQIVEELYIGLNLNPKPNGRIL